MDKSKPALLLYFTASLMYVLSITFNWDATIAFLFKPMIFPAIYFYYWQESKSRPYLLSSLVLWFFYIGDMILLIEYEDVVVPIILLNLSAYLILMFSVAKDLLKIERSEISKFMIAIIGTALLFFLSILYFALSLAFKNADSSFGLLTIYGVVLTVLGTLIVTNYVLKNDTASFFVLTAIFCFIISDLFHILFNYYGDFKVFIVINVFCQVVSFYFLVKYFLHNSHYNIKLSQDEE